MFNQKQKAFSSNNYNNNKYYNKNSPNTNIINNHYNNNYHNKANTNNNNIINTVSNEKSILLDYLYNKIDVSKYDYKIAKTFNDIIELKQSKYYVSGNSCGTNSFIVFMKYGKDFYSYQIDRRTISHKRDMLKKAGVRIAKINFPVDIEFYNGTIFDGIVSNLPTDNSGIMNFVITDVLLLNGKSEINTDYKKKMYKLNDIMTNLSNKNTDIFSNIKFNVSIPFELNQIKHMHNEYISPNIKLLNIKGLSFYPQTSGTKIIYMYDKDKNDEEYKNKILNAISSINDTETQITIQTEEENIKQENRKLIGYTFRLADIEYNKDIILNFEMEKTNVYDTYKLYSVFMRTKNKKTKYYKKFIDNVYIQSYKLSMECNKIFENNNKLIMECKYDSVDNCWIPIQIANDKRMHIINNDKRIILHEKYHEDNDDNDDDLNLLSE